MTHSVVCCSALAVGEHLLAGKFASAQPSSEPSVFERQNSALLTSSCCKALQAASAMLRSPLSVLVSTKVAPKLISSTELGSVV